MIYYKIISGDDFVGVATTDDLRRFQEKHRVILICDESLAQFIQVNDVLYHDNWLKPVGENCHYEYQTAKIVAIDGSEYESLVEAVENGEEITISDKEEVEEIVEEVELSHEDNVTIEFVRSAKISEMRKACEASIINGVDITTSDGKEHHFSLAITDQINLLSLYMMMPDDGHQIPYHADGEVCEYFTSDDVSRINNAAIQLRTYHTTYFNSLREYIKSLNDIGEIRNVYYGMSIPDEFRSDVLNNLIVP